MGFLIDIADPANPKRLAHHEVSDPNFAYWHSATFINDGTKVIFAEMSGVLGLLPHCRDHRPGYVARAPTPSSPAQTVISR